jgi:tetratricopeptide (TPR) repeat protein
MTIIQSRIIFLSVTLLSLSACRDEPSRHFELGNWYAQKGLVDDAILEYREAARLYPENPRDLSREDLTALSKTHHNLALMYTKKGWWNYALSEAEVCFELQPTVENHELVQLVRRRANLVDSDS